VTTVFHLQIAGIHFHIHNEISNKFRNLEPPYSAFSVKSTNELRNHTADLQMQIRTGNIPNTDNLNKIFSSGQSWSMFRDGSNYCLTIESPVFERPVLLARINHDFSKVTLCLDKKLGDPEKSQAVLLNPILYPFLQILTMYLLARRQGMLMHAAGVEINGNGYIFPGKSGAGKSTVTRLFATTGEDGLLSDDRIIVRKMNDVFKAYGTPWPGEEGVAVNTNVPLSGLFFITHSPMNRINKLSPRDALGKLLPVISIPWYDREIMVKKLAFCEELLSRIPACEFHFKPGIEAVDTFKEYVSKHS